MHDSKQQLDICRLSGSSSKGGSWLHWKWGFLKGLSSFLLAVTPDFHTELYSIRPYSKYMGV